jgi:hypothetical protein
MRYPIRAFDRSEWDGVTVLRYLLYPGGKLNQKAPWHGKVEPITRQVQRATRHHG